jgi:hypothetical protein
VGEHREDLNGEVTGTILGRAYVGPVHSATIREFLLRPILGLPELLDPLPDRKLDQRISLLPSLFLHSI